MDELTHLDLFSGIGGFSLAFEAEGFRTIGFSEIDPYASAILKHHWPGVPNYGDVRNVPAIECDVLTGGFPCQPFSQVRQSGQCKGIGDDRYLWPAMLTVIDKCRPTWVLGENVNGIIDMALDAVLSDLESLSYETQAIGVPACALDAIHVRERVWILAHSASQRCTTPKEIHTAADAQGRRKKQSKRNGQVRCLRDLASSNQCALSILCEQPVPAEPVPAEPVPADRGSDDGFSDELDAIRCFGNAIVPQVARVFACAIRQALTQ